MYKTVNSGHSIICEDKALGSGAEGDVFLVKEPASHTKYVAKIFKPEKVDPKDPNTKIRLDKLDYMVKHPPQLTNSHSVIWPYDLLLKQNKFIGYLMPVAVKGTRLSVLCLPEIKPKYKKDWGRFAHSEKGSELMRAKVCYNIGAALFQAHSVGKYVLVDLKPENVLIEAAGGQISIIDTDSVQVAENGKVLYRAPVATPEYSPAEKSKIDFNNGFIPEAWDNFSLGIVFYQVLFGIHPFSGTCKAPYNNCNEITEMIANGLYVHGKRTKGYFTSIPHLHDKFKQYPKAIQDLFERCFGDGHLDPSKRPNASEWCQAFKEFIDKPSLDTTQVVRKPLAVKKPTSPKVIAPKMPSQSGQSRPSSSGSGRAGGYSRPSSSQQGGYQPSGGKAFGSGRKTSFKGYQGTRYVQVGQSKARMVLAFPFLGKGIQFNAPLVVAPVIKWAWKLAPVFMLFGVLTHFYNYGMELKIQGYQELLLPGEKSIGGFDNSELGQYSSTRNSKGNSLGEELESLDPVAAGNLDRKIQAKMYEWAAKQFGKADKSEISFRIEVGFHNGDGKKPFKATASSLSPELAKSLEDAMMKLEANWPSSLSHLRVQHMYIEEVTVKTELTELYMKVNNKTLGNADLHSPFVAERLREVIKKERYFDGSYNIKAWQTKVNAQPVWFKYAGQVKN